MTMFYHGGTFISLLENPMRRLASLLTLSLFPLLGGCSSTPAAKPWSSPAQERLHQPDAVAQPVYSQGVSKGDFANRTNVDRFVQKMVEARF